MLCSNDKAGGFDSLWICGCWETISYCDTINLLIGLAMQYSATQKKKLVIVVEDEETIGNIMKFKLERAGYDAVLARDGGEGLELIHTRKPDLVLLDLVLPTMSGFEILEHLVKEKLLPGLPVIVISNSGQPVEIERILSFGIRDYLIKVNFSPHEVLNKVEQVLAEEDEKKPFVGPENAGSRKTILLIEDDFMLVDLLEKKLSQSFNLCKAPNVKEAQRILDSHIVDFILLDIVLPDIDGFTYLAELKANEKYKDIPVVIISNLGQKEEVEKGLRLGALDYVVKANVLPQQILDRVNQILERQSKK